MHSKVSAAALLIVAVALLPVPARADVVADWNVTANTVMTAENVGNNPRLRNLGMLAGNAWIWAKSLMRP
jgi:hypothetical protein